MSYCTRCGAYIPVGDTACPACGYDPEKEQAQAQTQQHSYTSGGAAQAQQAPPQQQTSGEYHSAGSHQTSGEYHQSQTQQQTQAMTWAPWEQENQQQSTGSGYSESESVPEDVRRISVLSYVGPLFLYPLLTRKDDEFVLYHANQGLLLFIFETITNILFGGILGLAAKLFALFCVVLGAKTAAAGRKQELPLIGRFRLLKGRY